MAKRFIDTNLIKEKWFRNYTKEEKILYIYVITQCDLCGVFEFDEELLEFFLGFKVTKIMIENLKNVIEFESDHFFITNFCSYQYGPLSTQSNAQAAVIKLLKKHGLLEIYFVENGDGKYTLKEGLANPSARVQDKDKDKDKYIYFKKDLVKTKSKKQTAEKLTFDIFSSFCEFEDLEFVKLIPTLTQQKIFEEFKNLRWIENEIKKFSDYIRANNRKYSDHGAALRNWLRRANPPQKTPEENIQKMNVEFTKIFDQTLNDLESKLKI